MEAAILLAYDVGTSGVKTSMISAAGQVVDSAAASYGTRYAPGGIAEQDPMDWWRGVEKTTALLMERNPGCCRQIAAIGVSGHMMGCIPVASDGTPLHPGMIHSDARAAAQYETICREVGAQRLYQMSGNILDARSSLSKILWVKETYPDLYKKTARFLQSKDFIVSRLTGNLDTTDYSDACHGELMDITSCRYDGAVYRQLGLDLEKLPALHRGCDIVGTVTAESAKALGLTAGIPVIAGGGDGACGSAGAANIQPGDAYLSLGSTAWIARVSQEPVIDPQSRVFNIMNLDGETSSVYGTMQSAGSSVRWVQQLLNVPDLERLNKMAMEIQPGCEGLVYLPYLDGERSPVFDANARGMFCGMSQHHEPRHFARAVMEGVAYALRNIADILRTYGPLTELRAIGGGMASSVWPQIIADVTGLRLQTLSVPAADATSLGVAAVAGAAVGVFPSIQAALAHVQVRRTLEPQPGDLRYERNYQAYLQLYPRLREVMHLLAQETNQSI